MILVLYLVFGVYVWLEKKSGVFYVIDLDSINGIYINNRRIWFGVVMFVFFGSYIIFGMGVYCCLMLFFIENFLDCLGYFCEVNVIMLLCCN